MNHSISKVVIIGAGTMGNGIAQLFLQKGFSVSLFDNNSEVLQRSGVIISKNMDRLVAKNVFNEMEKKAFLEKLVLLTEFISIPQDSDIIIEAISENLQAKSLIFKELLCVVNPNCIITSNTSSISITELARFSKEENFIGMHFMNPVPVMNLVEIIKGFNTSEDTYRKVYNLVLQIDKRPVCVNDYPGFISNRILMPMINEAIFALYEGVASAEDIDTIMKLGMNHPMGPLALADLIGLDVCLAIMEVLYNGFNDSKYRPCPLLKKMVVAGKIGKKSKEGFFKYGD